MLGAAADPLIFPSTELFAIAASDNVPAPVIVPPASPVPAATLVTVPALGEIHDMMADPLVERTCPFEPSADGKVQTVPPAAAAG